MRKTWLKLYNGILSIERNSGIKLEEYLEELDPDYPWVEIYDVYEDEDGTKVALISEKKYQQLLTKEADKLNERARIKYELRKQK